ncbi:hypothetical protein CGLO_11744 [Colletotrichum gloeosporioides Cg-14]|uniref:Uncharacterized protein n=1 Tax=Colletotrichum gloeosporioides (strain Cg-14) TaxID=1237896 RepID=T0LL42_COLGC|nr:hypothetical protein CGLO_11744 [Colletotrichum gloeosporioides Cg-14]
MAVVWKRPCATWAVQPPRHDRLGMDGRRSASRNMPGP